MKEYGIFMNNTIDIAFVFIKYYYYQDSYENEWHENIIPPTQKEKINKSIHKWI